MRVQRYNNYDFLSMEINILFKWISQGMELPEIEKTLTFETASFLFTGRRII
jgi:hypothetical protein